LKTQAFGLNFAYIQAEAALAPIDIDRLDACDPFWSFGKSFNERRLFKECLQSMSEVLCATAALLVFEQSKFNINASFQLAGVVPIADPSLAVISSLANMTSETAWMHYIIHSPAV